MSVSLEALAMSGANYLEVGFDINEWEQLESEVPPHLLADEEEENVEEEKKKIERKKVDQKYSGRSLFCSNYNTEDCYGYEGGSHRGSMIENRYFLKSNAWSFIMNRTNVCKPLSRNMMIKSALVCFVLMEKCRKTSITGKFFMQIVIEMIHYCT
ncbi:hypothetical protein ABFS83_12G012500 [Erythranthe nasuta]